MTSLPERREDAAAVAVIVVAFNSGSDLDRCLSCLAAQTLAPRRVIVIDNASADDAVVRAREAYPQFEYVRFESNLGFAAANNRGIERAADCALIALLNPDAFPEMDWLERLVAAAGIHPRAASFASLLLCDDDPTRIDGAGDACHVTGLAWRRHHRHALRTPSLRSAPVFSACAAAALYRREAVIDCGGFDERYFCYFEDVDLGMRLRLRGWDCHLVPAARARHVGSASSRADGAFALYHGHRNLVWCFWKNLPLPLLVPLLPTHLLMVLVLTLWFILRGQGGAILRARRDAIAGLGAALALRRQIRATRRIGSLRLLRSLSWRLPIGGHG